MAQWKRINDLFKKNKELHEKVIQLYSRSSFPYKMRSCFADWIDAQSWSELDLNSETGKKAAEKLFNDFMTRIRGKEEEMRISPTFDLEKILDFHEAKKAMMKDFQEYPVNEIGTVLYQREFQGNLINGTNGHQKELPGNGERFVEVVRKCLYEEHTLMMSLDAKNERKGKTGADEVPKAVENLEIQHRFDNLRQGLLAAEGTLRDLEQRQKEFLGQYRRLNNEITHLDQSLQCVMSDANRNDIVNAKKNRASEKEQLAFKNLERRSCVADTHIHLGIELARILQLAWAEVNKWQMEQRQMITGLVQPRKGTLEVLDKLFYLGGELLYRTIEQTEQVLIVLNQVMYTDDRKKQQIETVLREFTNDYLKMHLQKCFVVDQNIPDRILKVGSGQSSQFVMSTRLLGGRGLGMDFSKPKVKMALFFEKDIPKEDTFVAGACDIVNGDEKTVTIHHANNACVAQFHGIVLKNVKRPDRGRNEELVTDQKFAFVFFTTITMKILGENKDFHVKVVSLPVILTSQTSQEIMAKGTLIWDAAFSEESRTPFQYKDRVMWKRVAGVLNALFVQQTGRGLTDDHLKYLAKMAFRERNDSNLDFNNLSITEKQVVKDKLPQRDFSFWKWVWANLNLVKDRIKKEWQDGLIYGFISKDDVGNKLMDAPVGTFLLRFSETNIEISQRSDVSGYLTVSFVEKDPNTGQKELFHVKDYLKPQEILQHGLPNILNAMEVADSENPGMKKPLLRYIWPNMTNTFKEIFRSRIISPKEDCKYSGYRSGKYIIEICLTDNISRVTRTDSMDSSSNFSPYLASPHSSAGYPFSPPTTMRSICETVSDFVDDDYTQDHIEIPIFNSPSRQIAAVMPQIQTTAQQPGTYASQQQQQSHVQAQVNNVMYDHEPPNFQPLLHLENALDHLDMLDSDSHLT